MNDLLIEYHHAGCRSDADIIEMASSRGAAAMTEAVAAIEEQRENSTAMIIMPGTPPGRNVCAFIRKFAADRSKLIIVAQGSDLIPGSFERMLRASMPDVEKKLRVMDSGGPSLADSLNMAERNRHYRPSQALQVFCSSEQAPGFTQEIRDGGLKFDPTVITVQPTQIPKDSADDIRRAVESGDNAAMHRVLDPHVFSDQNAIHDYSQALLHESRLVDEVLHEFLRDIASSKQRGAERLARIANQNQELLRKRGIDIDGAEWLGRGNNGIAFKLRDNRVLKLTTDDAEAHVASFIKGKKFKHVFTIYDVWAFPGTFSRDSKSPAHHVYGLVTEADLEKPDQHEQDQFDWMVETLEQYAEVADVNLEDDLRAVLQAMMSSGLAPENKRQLLQYVKDFDLPGMMADMKRIGAMADLHSGNFMRRPDGTFVIIDIGTGGEDQETSKPPFIEGQNIFDIVVPTLDGIRLNEFGSGSPGSGMSGTPQTRGSNSSAWASGRLALTDPRNHVPEDEEEDSEESNTIGWGAGRGFF